MNNWQRQFWCVVLVLSTQSLIGGCMSKPVPRIRIIVPVNYKGQFQIVKDSHSGVGLQYANNAYTFTIPPSGVLRIKDDSPFGEWHELTVEDENGNAVAVKELGVSPGKRRVSNSSNHERIEFDSRFDGTAYVWEIKP